MKVLQIHNSYREPGGEDEVVNAEAAVLQEAGHEVIRHRVENPEGDAAAAGALLLSSWNPLAAHRVGLLVERDRPDVAHVHNTWYRLSPSTLWALQRHDVPVVLTLHNYRIMCANGLLYRSGGPCELCVGTDPWPGIRYRCYRNSLPASMAASGTIAVNRAIRTWTRNVDLFITMTEFAKNKFIEGGIPEDKLVVKPHFVADPGRRRGPPSASRDVVFAGRVSKEKGIDVLLAAWRDLAEADLELVVVGDGPLGPSLEAANLPRVRFTGRLSRADVTELMLGARALVFPSQVYETFGLSIVEAFAAGLPVLASGSGAAGELVGSLGDEWLVTPGDRAAWADALMTLSDDNGLDAVGSRSRQLYESLFTPEKGLESLLAAYKKAIDNFRSRET